MRRTAPALHLRCRPWSRSWVGALVPAARCRSCEQSCEWECSRLRHGRGGGAAGRQSDRSRGESQGRGWPTLEGGVHRVSHGATAQAAVRAAVRGSRGRCGQREAGEGGESTGGQRWREAQAVAEGAAAAKAVAKPAATKANPAGQSWQQQARAAAKLAAKAEVARAMSEQRRHRWRSRHRCSGRRPSSSGSGSRAVRPSPPLACRLQRAARTGRSGGRARHRLHKCAVSAGAVPRRQPLPLPWPRVGRASQEDVRNRYPYRAQRPQAHEASSLLPIPYSRTRACL